MTRLNGKCKQVKFITAYNYSYNSKWQLMISIKGEYHCTIQHDQLQQQQPKNEHLGYKSMYNNSSFFTF